MRLFTALLAAAALVVAASVFLAGRAGVGGANAGGSTFILHPGDTVTVPAVGQRCTLRTEGGAARLVCARVGRQRHQVSFFADQILVWTSGSPDRPAWSGKP